ncbi:MAG: tRNA uridine(34) 5-carboxymethylaminomethyl modification radical SAM/GNAT enzyme Elp3 [Thermoplasmata archaeon]|nr:tRNA uridine(34) 5-carboxymethylaminomethyl modification radical SAM/GNAT enzyme Elp3 [Thermoplasmata archaeon]
MARTVTAGPSGASPFVVPGDRDELEREKLRWIRAGIEDHMLSNAELLARASGTERARAAQILRRKPSRTLSGVAIVAVMTAPAACPHGKCTYCPGGLDHRSPQSYTGEEPSALRGAQLHYDARAITEHRLASLESVGHSTSKVEVILMGGTFPARPSAYREDVFRGVFEGLNGGPAATLDEAQHANETAARRCVSLTVETRPDWCDGRILPELLAAGVTRVEIGVECLTDRVLWATGRAHGVDEVRRATREARDRGLKVCYHWMLGLPGMDPERDLADFRTMFQDPDFRPDMLKIYPTLVVPGTALFDEWTSGRYAPYDTPTAARLLAREKAEIPPYVRIQRIQRDIPARLIAAGVRNGNLRQIAREQLRAEGWRCRCLRCREPGRGATPDPDALELEAQEYDASGGREVFLSWEDPATDIVAGFLRLRFPGSQTVGGLTEPVVRELKVLGVEVPVTVAPHGAGEYQHRGLGRALLEAAEARARDAGYRSLFVMSAVGTREYYRHLGYGPAGPWMSRLLIP